jgi:hypothetical protein
MTAVGAEAIFFPERTLPPDSHSAKLWNLPFAKQSCKGTNNPQRSHAVGSIRICLERLLLELDDDRFGITGSCFMRMRYRGAPHLN